MAREIAHSYFINCFGKNDERDRPRLEQAIASALDRQAGMVEALRRECAKAAYMVGQYDESTFSFLSAMDYYNEAVAQRLILESEQT